MAPNHEPDDVSDNELRRIDEQLDQEEALSRRLAGERWTRRYRQSIPVVAAIFFVAAALWALTGAALPFLQTSVLGQGRQRFTEVVQKLNFAAQSVSYAGLFTLGGVLIVAHLVRRP